MSKNLSNADKKRAQEAKRRGQSSFTGDDGTLIYLTSLAYTDYSSYDSGGGSSDCGGGGGGE